MGQNPGKARHKLQSISSQWSHTGTQFFQQQCVATYVKCCQLGKFTHALVSRQDIRVSPEACSVLMTDLNYSDSSSLPKQKQIFAINHIVYPNCCHVAKGRNTKTLLSGRLFQELEGYLPRTSHTLSLECKVWNNPVLLSSLLFFSLLAWSWPRLSYYKANIFF